MEDASQTEGDKQLKPTATEESNAAGAYRVKVRATEESNATRLRGKRVESEKHRRTTHGGPLTIMQRRREDHKKR